MDYHRNSFAKNIDNVVTLYDVRHFFNYNKKMLYTDDGLKNKFVNRMLFLKENNTCPLTISAIDEIIENLEDDYIEPAPHPVSSMQDIRPVGSTKIKPTFSKKSGSLDEVFNSSTEDVLNLVLLEAIKKAVELNNHNLEATSKFLGINRRTLRYRIREIQEQESLNQ